MDPTTKTRTLSFMRSLGKVILSAGYYHAEHPAVAQAADEARTSLEELHRTLSAGSLTLALEEGRWLVNADHVADDKAAPEALGRLFARCRFRSITFLDGASADDLRALGALNRRRGDSSNPVDPANFLTDRNVSRIRVDEIKYAAVTDGQANAAPAERQLGDGRGGVEGEPWVLLLLKLLKQGPNEGESPDDFQGRVAEELRGDLDRWKAEALQELLQEQARLKGEVRRQDALLEAVCAGSLILDEEGRVAAAQPAAERLLVSDPIGMKLRQTIARTQELLVCRHTPGPDEEPVPIRVRGEACAGIPDAALLRDEQGRAIGLLREGGESARARELRQERQRLRRGLEEGRLMWRAEELPPGELLARAEERTALLLKNKGIRISRREGGELPMIEGQPELLVQAIAELLTNAVRYSTTGGEIVLGASRSREQAESVTISVTDFGPGLSKDLLDRLLEHLASGEGGTAGLGLALARSVVVRHKGVLWGRSRVGFGSTFYFTLPGKAAKLPQRRRWWQRFAAPLARRRAAAA